MIYSPDHPEEFEPAAIAKESRLGFVETVLRINQPETELVPAQGKSYATNAKEQINPPAERPMYYTGSLIQSSLR